MNMNDFEKTFAGLKQSEKIKLKCDHPDCLNPEKVIGREAAKRNILKNGGEKFVCGNCEKRFNNPMNKIGQGRKNLGELNVLCPKCKKTRKMNASCYFGVLSEPYSQICGSCSQIGKEITDEQKQKISQKLIGRSLTEDHKKNISKYMKFNVNGIEQGKRNLIPGSGGGWNKGLKTPQEICDKQSAAMLGRVYSDEHKANISEGRKKFLSETGGFTLEHRQKLRDAALDQYERGFNPNAHHRYGYHKSTKCEKAFYRSSYEKKAFMILDEMQDVKKYEVEKIKIPYWNPLEKTEAIFIVDILVELHDGSRKIIEIKPISWMNSLVNASKIDALKIWSEKENVVCEIWDEHKLFGEVNTYQKIQKFIDWIDSGSVGDIENVNEDIINARKEKSRLKSNNFYENNLSNKIIVFCKHCQKQHEVREITYKQHLEKYGTYKCSVENGAIGGSAPKPKKENPYAIEGKKECNNCKCVKDFEEFGLDKLKSDGYATQCKICRSDKSRKNYIKIKSNQEE
jgi:putative component of toxin-antitoxin plasmid stabilization module